MRLGTYPCSLKPGSLPQPSLRRAVTWFKPSATPPLTGFNTPVPWAAAGRRGFVFSGVKQGLDLRRDDFEGLAGRHTPHFVGCSQFPPNSRASPFAPHPWFLGVRSAASAVVPGDGKTP